MAKHFFAFLILLGIAVLFTKIVPSTAPGELQGIARHYARHGIAETGAENIVSAVVVTYRGLDTLGEVTILFLAAAIISFFTGRRVRDHSVRASSELLLTAGRIITPVIFLFGVYVFVHGHLTPGGGFQGGAIMASGFLLRLLTREVGEQPGKFLSIIESLSGFTYLLIGLLGIVLAGGFLDNRLLPLGTPGALLSAGAIPFIYALIGSKVGSELSSILTTFETMREE